MKNVMTGRFGWFMAELVKLSSWTTTFQDDGNSKARMANSGFTLIELLVVVLIIGILAAVALPQYEKAILKARMGEAKTVLASMKMAVRTYYLETGNWPTSLDDLDITIPANKGYWIHSSITALDGEMLPWLFGQGFLLGRLPKM